MRVVRDDTNVVLAHLVETWTAELLEHMSAAKKADEKVKRRLVNIAKLYVKHDESQRRAKIKVDWDLHDALDSYRNHCAEVERYSNAIQAIAAAQSFLANLPAV